MRVAMWVSQAGFPRALDLSRLGVSGKPGAVQSRRQNGRAPATKYFSGIRRCIGVDVCGPVAVPPRRRQ